MPARDFGMPRDPGPEDAERSPVRPIMMTTFAAAMGALPIAMGIGAGADARRSLGLAVVGGLAVSQLLTLYITPVMFLYMDRIGRWVGIKLRRADDAGSEEIPGEVPTGV